MLTIGTHFFDEACLDLRGFGFAFVGHRIGSKSSFPKVTGMMEEHLLVLVLSSCNLGHTRLEAFNFLHEFHL
jgi:hypothetical protein